MSTSKTTDRGDSDVEAVELFLHQQCRDPVVVDARSDQRVEDLLRSAGITDLTGQAVFVGESVAEDDDDSAVDAHEVADARKTLNELGLGRTGHVHCYRCRRVSVDVNYKCDTRQRTFPPAATVQRVLRWAKRTFRLTDADAENLLLRICDSDERLRLNQRLGELVTSPACSVCFDLVHDQRVEG
jgi:hypothetical protein